MTVADDRAVLVSKLLWDKAIDIETRSRLFLSECASHAPGTRAQRLAYHSHDIAMTKQMELAKIHSTAVANALRAEQAGK